MRLPALVGQGQALLDAEAVLLVDHGEGEILEHHILLKQRVGADDQRQAAIGKAGENGRAVLALVAAGQQRDA